MKGVSICVPLKNPTIELVKKASKVADFIEIWIDTLTDKQVEILIKSSKKPIIVVCKTKSEMGSFTGTDDQKIERLAFAANAGASYIDCGSYVAQNKVSRLKKILLQNSAELIISTHYFKNSPSLFALEQHALKLYRRGADVVKIATMIKSPIDTVNLFELASRLKKRNLPFVTVGMGPHSKIARVGCAVLGGEFTFAALDSQSVTASGQLTVAEMSNVAV